MFGHVWPLRHGNGAWKEPEHAVSDMKYGVGRALEAQSEHHHATDQPTVQEEDIDACPAQANLELL